ncbi:MAG: NADH-quinone oxidoreductase subunit N [Deltaproteobacteria bacterium]|nr:NADH-quinone oxidoreductase subunit N [Deltaproteobacteria bacterium]
MLLVDVGLLRAKEPASRAAWIGGLTVLGLVGVLALLGQHLAVTGDLYFMDRDRVLVIDRLAIVLRIIIVALALGASLLSIRYPFTKHYGEYFALLLFATVGLNLLVATENLLMFFVALELLSVCLYALTGMHRGVLRSAEGAVKYFMVGALSSAFLLFGLSWIVGSTGATDLPALRDALAGGGNALRLTGLVFVVVGLGFKLAAVPFHTWTPDAYQGAPTPVTAFIATASKVASFVVGAKILLVGFAGMAGSAHWPWRELSSGTFGAARIEPGWVLLLAVLAAASMIWGNLAALTQKNVKRMLAYSSIAHTGYLLLGVMAANQAGLTAVLAYLVAYAVTTLGAFGVVAALTRQLGGDDLEDLDGLARRAPGMALLLLVFVLSLAGIPPLAGFIAKFNLFAVAVRADAQELGLLWLVFVGLAGSAVSLYYYVLILKHALVHAPRRSDPVRVDTLWMVPLVVLAVLVVVIGAWPQPLLELFGALVEGAGLIR